MSAQQHSTDLGRALPHKTVSGSTEGGACLNRHQARAQNSCSHQWQASDKGEGELRALYAWPRYQNMPAVVQVFFQGRTLGVGKPLPPTWDPGHGTNFQRHCNVPYFHEAHHIVPNSTLAKAIREVFGPSGNEIVIRGTLLAAGYNLNHKTNMINLPLDPTVAQALRLPRHRKLPLMAHPHYSTAVENELKRYFMHFLQVAASCGPADAADLKSAIEAVSVQAEIQIVIAGEEPDITALDEMPEEWMDFGPL